MKFGQICRDHFTDFGAALALDQSLVAGDLGETVEDQRRNLGNGICDLLGVGFLEGASDLL